MEEKKSTRTIPKGTFIFCIIFGVLNLIFAVFLSVSTTRSRNDFYSVDSTVSKIGANGAVYVNYSYDNQEYKDIIISKIMDTPSVGDSLSIYISKTDYTIATTDQVNRYIAKLIYICGGIFTCTGIICMIIRRILVGKEDSIINAGKYIYADVTKVVYETSVSDENGRHPFTIMCHYEDFTGKHTHDYVIKDVYTNPNAYLEANNNRLKLFIKDKNYKKYRFDESILNEN